MSPRADYSKIGEGAAGTCKILQARLSTQLASYGEKAARAAA
jgi:hypothetical protein